MPSEKAVRALKAKTNLSDDQIARLSEDEAWDAVAGAPARKKPRDTRPRICFTGFRPAEKERLEQLAVDAGLRPVQSVTAKLDYLCTGADPGPAKVQKAQRQNVTMLTAKQFAAMLDG